MNWFIRIFFVFGCAPIIVAQTDAVHVEVDARQTIRIVDARLFGVNTAIWDSHFSSDETADNLREMGIQALRFPGGSTSDEYHWSAISKRRETSFDQFAHVATNIGAQVFITVNYGSGTPDEAAAWVRYSNVTNHYGFKYWEIGNENYGGWEHDENSPQHDPVTYATRAGDFLRQMKAADPDIKIGVVAEAGEDRYNSHTNHSVLNPRSGIKHSGWTPIVLSTLKNLGDTPDFLIYHRYPQNHGKENDTSLLQSAATWPDEAADLRQQLKDYFGDAGANVELVCTENNSVSDRPGKQTTSLVNALYLADSFGQIAQTEFNALVWWDLRNGRNTNNNNDPSLYGWGQYGDYGLLSGPTNRYPTFYAEKLLKKFARGGDRILRANNDNPLLATYAARRANGSLALLVINKNPANSLTADFSLANFSPSTNATVFSYGIPQDEAARTGIGSPDIAQEQFTEAATNFSRVFQPYSVTVILLSPSANK
jgi:hypothetical protein